MKLVRLLSPLDVRRSFSNDVAKIKQRKIARPKPKARQHNRSSLWPVGRLNYEALERCKIHIVSARHPSRFMKYRFTEIRVSLLPWSRGSYLDIRHYRRGSPTGVGILLHLDILSALFPHIQRALDEMRYMDSRAEGQKDEVELVVSPPPIPPELDGQVRKG